MSQEILSYLKKKVREKVKNRKTKLQVSKELGISYKKVQEYTKDIKSIQGGISKRA